MLFDLSNLQYSGGVGRGCFSSPCAFGCTSIGQSGFSCECPMGYQRIGQVSKLIILSQKKI